MFDPPNSRRIAEFTATISPRSWASWTSMATGLPTPEASKVLAVSRCESPRLGRIPKSAVRATARR